MRHEQKSFRDAFVEFLFSGGTGRTFLIMLMVMACAVGGIYMITDLVFGL